MLNFHHDQAAGLRQIMTSDTTKVMTVLSATTEPHPSRFVSNLASAIHLQDADTLVLQAAKNQLSHYRIKALPALNDVAHKGLSFEQAVKPTQFGFFIAKLQQRKNAKTQLAQSQDEALNQTFNTVTDLFEVVLVDAVLNENHQLPLDTLNANNIMIQLTCDAESIKQAYSMIKRIYSEQGRRTFGIVIWNATDTQAATTFRNLSQVARDYLQVNLEFLGAIPVDTKLNRAYELGRAVVDAFPTSSSAQAFKALAQRIHYKQAEVVEAATEAFV